MTAAYDVRHASYVDEKSARDEFTRVAEVCIGCRRCVDLCGSFPTLFELVDALADHDAGRLTPAQQDQVVDGCFQCTLCSTACPFRPGVHEQRIDFPQLMLRMSAMQHATGQTPLRARLATRLLGGNGVVARLARAPAGSTRRRLSSHLTGISATRLLPGFAERPFSIWFRRRAPAGSTSRRRNVTIFPSCEVEYHAPDVGAAVVDVYERNGIGCSIAAARCCGAPWLHAGDLDRFGSAARKNVRLLAAAIREGRDIIVAEPTCHDVLAHRYVDHLGSPDAQLVADHVHDAAAYLIDLHRAVDDELDTDFRGDVPERVTYHAACHRRGSAEHAACELLELAGTEVTTVDRCCGVGVTWGWLTGHEPTSLEIGRELCAAIDRAGGAEVVVDCHRSGAAVVEQTGVNPSHPFELIARAYGRRDT
jgi:Fe-S oxidoreductase